MSKPTAAWITGKVDALDRSAASVRVWPRTCCIYCGTRLLYRKDGLNDGLLTCKRHRYLLRLDPEYMDA